MNGGLLKKHKKLKQKTIYTMIKQIFQNIEEKTLFPGEVESLVTALSNLSIPHFHNLHILFLLQLITMLLDIFKMFCLNGIDNVFLCSLET